MRPYCDGSRHRAIMGTKEGHKAAGEKWRDVLCLMVCPLLPRNTAKTLIWASLSSASSYLIFLSEQVTRDKSPRTDKCEVSIMLTNRKAVVLFPLQTDCGESLCCQISLYAWSSDVYGEGCVIWKKSFGSVRMKWGKNICVWVCV